MFKGVYMTEGIAIGFPIRAKIKPSSGSDRDIKDSLTNPDVAIVIGWGVPVGGKAGIEFRYTGGFKKLDKVSGNVQRNRNYAVLLRIDMM